MTLNEDFKKTFVHERDYWKAVKVTKQALARLQKESLIDLQTGFLTIRWSDVKEIFGEELLK